MTGNKKKGFFFLLFGNALRIFSWSMYSQESGNMMYITIHILKYDTYRDMSQNCIKALFHFFLNYYLENKNYLNINTPFMVKKKSKIKHI